MSIIQVIRLFVNHWKLLFIIPVFVSCVVFVLIKDEKRTYKTTATLYTGFASGKTITEKGRGRTDFFLVQTKFDNLYANFRSRSNKEQIALKLLAFYLSQDTINAKDMSEVEQARFYEVFSPGFLEDLIVKGSAERTFEKLREYYYSDFDNEIYYILNSQYSPLIDVFGIGRMSAIEAYQEGTSDRVGVYFPAQDPGVCYNTVRVALEVITEGIKEIQADESVSVVSYFKAESEKARERLDQAEYELSVLMTKYNIINYYEQTRYIAERKENFEVAFQQENLVLIAAKAAEQEAYLRLDVGEELVVHKRIVDSLRTDLRDITARIAFNQLEKENRIPGDSAVVHDSVKVELLIREQERIKKSLQMSVKKITKLNNHVAGMKLEGVAQKWFDAIIAFEESAARLNQYEIFKKEFQQTYALFASLGSEIKQKERKIDVLEQDYLDLLASLNDSKLLQQSIEMSSNLRVVDAPFYPVNAEKSMKLVTLILSFVGSFVLILGVLILLEFFDDTIKTCERLEELTETTVIGGMPYLTAGFIVSNKPLIVSLVNQMVTAISSKRLKSGHLHEPFIVLFVSCRQNEGKSLISRLIAREMRLANRSTLLLSPKEEDFKKLALNDDSEDNKSFELRSSFSESRLSDIVSRYRSKSYDFIFVELPEIIGSEMPVRLIQESKLSILVSKSSRTWSVADQKALDNYSEMVEGELLSIINGVTTNVLESIIGEIPKKRSKLRKKIKELALMQFGGNKF